MYREKSFVRKRDVLRNKRKILCDNVDNMEIFIRYLQYVRIIKDNTCDVVYTFHVRVSLKLCLSTYEMMSLFSLLN